MADRRRTRHPGRALIALIALMAVLLALVIGAVVRGAGLPSFGMPAPVTEAGDRTRTLWQILFSAAVGVGVLVWGLIAWSVVRYRRRDGDEIPDQDGYNIPVEVLYTVLPIIAVFAIFVATVLVQRENTGLSTQPDVVVEVTGFQWQWRFAYPGEGVTITGTSEPGSLPEIVLPVDRTIRFELVSTDVIHSFWVPRFLTKRDLIPGIDNAIDVHPTETGTYDGRCAEYCGLDHARMGFVVRVVSEGEYERWLETARDPA